MHKVRVKLPSIFPSREPSPSRNQNWVNPFSLYITIFDKIIMSTIQKTQSKKTQSGDVNLMTEGISVTQHWQLYFEDIHRGTS